MKLRKFALASIATAVMAVGTAAQAADNSLTFQGVTFQTTVIDSDTLSFSILNATSATGNWTGIHYLKAFEIKNIGGVTWATISPNDLSPVDAGLSANGCPGPNGSAGMCFIALSTPLTLAAEMIWTIDLQGTNLNLYGVSPGSDPSKPDYGIIGPTVKVDFWKNLSQTNATGDLLSLNVSPVPEPEIYAIMAVGLGFLGWAVRRKKAAEAVAA